MSLRILSVTLPLVSLFFFSAFVVASGVNVTANCTFSSYFWTFNSIGQSPCTVAAYMLSTCFAGSYALAPLKSGFAYPGPSHDYSNKCQCSTVGYSLTSACVACQGLVPYYWSTYVANCTSTSLLPPSQFPNPVPEGIHVPYWAILDVTNENDWDSDKAHQAGDGPEYGPGAIFGPSGVYTSGVATSSASASSHSWGHRHEVPIITGSVSVGIVISIALAVAVYFYKRRKRSQAASAGVDYNTPYHRLPNGGHGGAALPSSEELQRIRVYNPSEPTPSGHPDGSRSLDLPSASRAPLSPHLGSASYLTPASHTGSGGTVTGIQSQPRAGEYRGLPCV